MHAPRRIHISQLAPSTTAKHTLKIVSSFEIHESELKRDEAWQPWRRLSVYTEGDARYVVCGGRDGSVMFFNTSHASKEKTVRPVESFRLRHPQCMRPVTSIAVRADGLYVVACNSKNTIAIWKRERDASGAYCKLPAYELQPATSLPPAAAQLPS